MQKLLAPLSVLLLILSSPAFAGPQDWQGEWPRTDFTRTSVDYGEILSGGPPKDGIPPIDDPKFQPVSKVEGLADSEPVITFDHNGDARAYPLRVMIWHEIVNDVVGDLPVTVTYCPLCNSGIVFDRNLDGRVLDFGTTGKLRNSDLVMYDRQTESWWQQFLGEGIVGQMTGKRLTMLASRFESFARFRDRFPDGRVLVPRDLRQRDYGTNPYAGYDTAERPFLYAGPLPAEIAPLKRVVIVAGEAWSLDLLQDRREIRRGDLLIRWEAGQNSALDTAEIARGRDVGNVTVQRRVGDHWQDVVHDLTFAFVFTAFYPEGRLNHLP
ncbi:MAG: DUF3179 domain-containing protein [Rhodospirillales bacterium]